MNFPQLEKLTEELSDTQLDQIINHLKSYDHDPSKENRFDKLHIIYNSDEKDIQKAIQKIREDIYQKLKNLSENQLRQITDLLEIGISQEPEDKEELILILMTEPLKNLEKAINQIKESLSQDQKNH